MFTERHLHLHFGSDAAVRFAMQIANMKAGKWNQPIVECEHLLLGALEAAEKYEEENVIEFFSKFGMTKQSIEVLVSKLPAHNHMTTLRKLPYSRRVEFAMSYAVEEAVLTDCESVVLEHLCVAAFRAMINPHI